jgi:hypothetical protein
LYYSHQGIDIVILLLYVDDLFLTCSNSLLVDQLKAQLQSEFAMTDLNLITRYLGVQFHCTSHGLLLQQTAYAHSILALTNMEDSRPTLVPYQDGIILRHFMGSLSVHATIYRQGMGKLLYLTRTHLDLAHVVGLVSRYMQALEESHMAAVKAITCYLCHYPSTGLYFVEGEESNLLGFSNIDFAHVLDDRISTGAYIFVLGTTPVSWSSKKQTTTARSSYGAEYRALSNCTYEAIWFWKLFTEIGFAPAGHMVLHCDNQRTIKLSKNLVFHDKSKHFEKDWHFSRQMFEAGEVEIKYILSNENLANMLTKALGRIKFEQEQTRLNMMSLEDAKKLY